MRIAETFGAALRINGICRVAQPDGSWIVYEPGDGVPEGLFGAPSNGVPAEVTMRQARQALHIAGLLTDVEAAIDAMTEPPRELARIAWEHSQVIERRAPFVLQLAAALGMSDAEVDALFVSAASL